MCTAITYQTRQLYFGRTLDYECSYGEQVTITPRNYPFDFRHAGPLHAHYAIIGMAMPMMANRTIEVPTVLPALSGLPSPMSNW